jgi:hypothetical protein
LANRVLEARSVRWALRANAERKATRANAERKATWASADLSDSYLTFVNTLREPFTIAEM